MAERQTTITPARGERRLGPTRPWDRGWGGNPLRTLQRMADEMDHVFEDFGFGRRWARPFWPFIAPEAALACAARHRRPMPQPDVLDQAPTRELRLRRVRQRLRGRSG